MDIRRFSIISGTAVLALAGAAVAAPTIVTTELTAKAADWWGWFGPGYYGYSGPVCSGAIIPGDGIYCETSMKTCVIKERPGLQGTGCFCKVRGGFARGVVE